MLDPPFPRDRATEAAAARDPTAPGTEQTIRGASKLYNAVANPVLSSLFTSQTTRGPTRSRLRSEVQSLYPHIYYLQPAWGFGAAPATQDVPRER